MATKVSSAKSYSRKDDSVHAPSPGKVKSPCRTPADTEETLGGMPPTKKIEAINAANEPKSAPGAVHGI